MAFDLKRILYLLAVFSLPLLAVAADCECQPSDEGHDKGKSRTLKIIAIFCILVGSSAGCAIPSLGRRFPALRPDTNFFFAIKAFAAGVILATAFVHILPVLELGIIVHSIIIGISLGASESPSTIRPLVAALTFHQFFEGIGLGGCIVQARFRLKSTVTMAIFFSITTPLGIVIGIGISSAYNENSPTALIVEGLLDAAAAGILNYMALVDLLAEDFMNPRVHKSGMLQLLISVSLLVGTALMSLLGIWA
uniref:Uncharacterized protein n=1 Tax=Oryza brachyantha TaxID=4533 RepID=J3M825_ORYBR